MSKYGKEDLKIVAREMFSQGEFETYNEAYETLCDNFDKGWPSQGWLDYFFEKARQGPVTVTYNRDTQNYNCLVGKPEDVYKKLSGIDWSKVTVKGKNENPS